MVETLTTNSLPEFDWASVEQEQNLLKRKINPSIKLNHPTDKVYSHEEYAQELYDLYNDPNHQIVASPPIPNSLVEGKILNIRKNQAVIDIGHREEAILHLEKEAPKYLDFIEVGQTIKVKVINDPERQGYVNVSFSAAAEKLKELEIREAIGNDSVAYSAIVKSLVTGGYMVAIDGIEVFMPGSLAGINKLHDFESLLGQELSIMPVNYDQARETIVVSRRKYLQTLIPSSVESLHDNLDTKITGFVTGSTSYGVFCEFNDCLTGMIHVSDLDDHFKELHEEKNLKPGTAIEFYVKEIIHDKKIILAQTLVVNPWSDIEKRYQIPCTVTGTITSIKEYGAFIEIEPQVTGLLHQTEFEDVTLTEGEEIDVNITRIDKSTKKIYLKLVN